MEFEGFEWDIGNSAKCQKHGLSVAEIESVFSRRVLIVNDKANSELEPRFRAIGVTASGRRAFIVFHATRQTASPPERPLHAQEGDRPL